jgi:hypothetical protein
MEAFIEGVKNNIRENRGLYRSLLNDGRRIAKVKYLKGQDVQFVYEKINKYGIPIIIALTSFNCIYQLYHYEIMKCMLTLLIYFFFIINFNKFYKKVETQLHKGSWLILLTDLIIYMLEVPIPENIADNRFLALDLLDMLKRYIDNIDRDIIFLDENLKAIILNKIFEMEIALRPSNVINLPVQGENGLSFGEIMLSNAFINNHISRDIFEADFSDDAITMEQITENVAYTINESNNNFVCCNTLKKIIARSLPIPKNPFTNEPIRSIKKWNRRV